MTSRRDFLKKAGIGGAAIGASALAAPAVVRAQAPIKWRMQTYAGSTLGQFVTKPFVDSFNKAANGEMEIELFYCRPDRTDGRTLPRLAGRNHRRRAFGR